MHKCSRTKQLILLFYLYQKFMGALGFVKKIIINYDIYYVLLTVIVKTKSDRAE
jgi:hypothetical protein